MIPNHSWSQFEEFSRGNERIYLPSDYTDSTSYPLVILLHAYGMNSDTAELIWGLSQSVDEYQFIYAVPSGTVDQSDSYFWNSNTACCNFYNSTVDDVSYLNQYIESLKKIKDICQEKLLPGHGNIIIDGRKRCLTLIEHRNKRTSEILKLLESNDMDASQITAIIYSKLSPNLRNYAFCTAMGNRTSSSHIKPRFV